MKGVNQEQTLEPFCFYIDRTCSNIKHGPKQFYKEFQRKKFILLHLQFFISVKFHNHIFAHTLIMYIPCLFTWTLKINRLVFRYWKKNHSQNFLCEERKNTIDFILTKANVRTFWIHNAEFFFWCPTLDLLSTSNNLGISLKSCFC